MARPLDRLEQLAFAQLIDLSHDRARGRFPSNGSFVRAKRGHLFYWYYQGYTQPADGSPGAKTRVYVGPVDDPETETLRREHEALHTRYRERRRIAASLRRIGLAAATPFDGAVIDAIEQAGVFEAEAILIGSMAFQTYSGLVGWRLDDALMQTADVDLAQPGRLSLHVSDEPRSNARLESLLQRVDPTFEPILDRAHPATHLGYRNKAGYKVEFLTTTRKRGGSTTAMPLSGIDGVSAQPVQYLEYLLEQPVRSIVLHDDSVPVIVPDPARYAIHKLIVAPMRERMAAGRGTLGSTYAKVDKDLAQATALVTCLQMSRRRSDVALAWEDAWRRGPKWRDHLRRGVAKLTPDAETLLGEIVLETIGPTAWPTRLTNASDR